MPEIRDYYESIDIHIRLADGSNLIVTVSPIYDTIESLKQKIRQSVPKRTHNMNIRLIYQGRILTGPNEHLSHYGIGKRTRIVGKDELLPPIETPLPVYIHCSISDYVSRESNTGTPYQQNHDRRLGSEDDEDDDNGNNNNTGNQVTPLLGFDRLQETGFNEEEIRDIRTQFHRLHGSPNFDGEITEQTIAMEEQWMESTGEILPDGLVQGTYKEMMWGLLLGFFLGILCVFWFRESVFTRRHQMGIVAGMLINISFGVLHVYH
ncbi:DUF2407 C-terminal domain-containing protein [Phascolomyces articulosus]|uniref:DUF2407 C-terminal domain-containing protein n=1 Tax=Phascolomyces articulosus TaxID=60185 RepID=A0AAD5KL78_9FUNG|nr:DUF2407 C-terminal domain-containing protein [Phascolomyces articulosus]